MTPLIIIPARQMSAGVPCKNREHWEALTDALRFLPDEWPRVVVTDDPWVGAQDERLTHWLPMGAAHTVAGAVQYGISATSYSGDGVVVLQPSSPTNRRAVYVHMALWALSRVDCSAVVSVVPWEGEPPSKACRLSDDGALIIPPTPEARQLQQPHYRRDGTVYAVRTEYAKVGALYGPRPIPLLVDPKDSVTI